MKLSPHWLDLNENISASVHPANPDVAAMVMLSDVDDPDGRSQLMWIRLPSGELILGVFPQGTTYEAAEKDALYPKEANA